MPTASNMHIPSKHSETLIIINYEGRERELMHKWTCNVSRKCGGNGFTSDTESFGTLRQNMFYSVGSSDKIIGIVSVR